MKSPIKQCTTFIGAGLLAAVLVGCGNDGNGSANSTGHEMGYKDATPTSIPPTAAGSKATNDPTNTFPAGGIDAPKSTGMPNANKSN